MGDYDRGPEQRTCEADGAPLLTDVTDADPRIRAAGRLAAASDSVRLWAIATAESIIYEHLEDADDVVTSEELQEKRDMESLEDLMNRMGAAPSAEKTGRPTMEDAVQTSMSIGNQPIVTSESIAWFSQII